MQQTLFQKSKSRSSEPLRYCHQVADGVFQVTLPIVNVFLVGPRNAEPGEWILVDTGTFFSASKILRAVDEVYGSHSRPAAIVLTHGHFDHIGSVADLANHWNIPVYCHPLEAPYLDGRSAYPPPDPGVGGGMMSLLSPLYPRGPINISSRLRYLPRNGRVPGAAGWEWIHTPGHTPGHVSLYNPEDGILIAGDAFVTTRQESLVSALLKPTEINGPPRYFTPDWESAWKSVVMLSRLPLQVAVTGHGHPVSGHRLRYRLRELADNFWTMAVPDHGRYVDDPAEADSDGVTYVPGPTWNVQHVAVLALAVSVVSAVGIFKAIRR